MSSISNNCGDIGEINPTKLLEVIRKGHNTHFIHHVEAASSVKVENGVKGPRVPVKEVFIVHQGIGIAEFHDCIVSGAIFGQVTQP